MDDPVIVNRSLNRASRFLNLAAVTLADSKITSNKTYLASIVNLISEIFTAQQALYKKNPDLEYHFDPDRPPTQFMQQVAALESEAAQAVQRGRYEQALAKLDEALNLEPPALAYEVLENYRNDLLRHT